MRNFPKDLSEANERIVAYIEKLKKDGFAPIMAHSMAMYTWQKIKHHFADEKGTICGYCYICNNPILHLHDEYFVSSENGENKIWHKDCKK